MIYCVIFISLAGIVLLFYQSIQINKTEVAICNFKIYMIHVVLESNYRKIPGLPGDPCCPFKPP